MARLWLTSSESGHASKNWHWSSFVLTNYLIWIPQLHRLFPHPHLSWNLFRLLLAHHLLNSPLLLFLCTDLNLCLALLICSLFYSLFQSDFYFVYLKLSFFYVWNFRILNSNSSIFEMILEIIYFAFFFWDLDFIKFSFHGFLVTFFDF